MKISLLHKVITIGFVVILVASFATILMAQEDERPAIGVRFGEADNGIVVEAVMFGSSADEAGLEKGDIITAIDGEPITSRNVADVLNNYSPGDVVTLSVIRDDETLEIELTLGSATVGGRTEALRIPRQNRPFIGVTVEQVDEGLLITSVQDDSPASAVDLQVDDVIVAVNGTTLTTQDEIVAILAEMSIGDEISIEILRGDETVSVDVTLGERPQVETSRAPRLFASPTDGDIGISITEDGITLHSLSEESALFEAGLREGDTITAINGEAFSIDGMRVMLEAAVSGDDLTLTIMRDDETIDLEIGADVAQTLFMGGFAFGRNIMPNDFNFRINPRGNNGRGGNFNFDIRPNRGIQLGVQFVSLNESVAEEYETDQTTGAYVVEVLPDSLAEEAGLQIGDVITVVSGDVIDEERTLRDRISAYEPGDTITLEVMRDGEAMEVEITFPAPVESSDASGEFGFAIPQDELFTFGMPGAFGEIMVFPEFGNAFMFPNFDGGIFEFHELPELEIFAGPQI